MPFPNFHAARVRSTNEFERIVVVQTLSNGAMIYGGPLKGKPGSGPTAQSYRFPVANFTAAQAKKWLKENDIKTTRFEKASGKNTEAVESFMEQCDGAFAECEIVEAESTIRNVVLLGAKSKNGRTYTESAMRKAVPMYEGRKCFLNHATWGETQSGRREVERLIGKFANCRFDETDKKLKGDAVLLKDDLAAGKFLNIARQMPEVAGLSHNATGRIRRVGGQTIVEEITDVVSVDLVAEPATTSGMFEHVEPKKENEMEWEELTSDLIKKHRHDIFEDVRAEGIKSRDEEVSKLKESNETLTKELDEKKVVEALREKEATVARLLTASELPEEAVTDVFKASLKEAKDEKAIEALIADRKDLCESKGVKNMGGEKGKGKGKDKVDEDAVTEALAL